MQRKVDGLGLVDSTACCPRALQSDDDRSTTAGGTNGVADSASSESESSQTPPPTLPGALPWPVPGQLEGAKSRKRVVWEVEAAELAIGSEVSRISRLKVNLFSRIAAIGEAGRAAAELMLGSRQLVSSKVKQQEKLHVVHLSPGIVTSPDATRSQIDAAIGAALKSKPHIIILDEARGAENAAWNEMFVEMLEGDALKALKSFRGGLVICVEEETKATRAFCSERWLGSRGWLWQEEPSSDSLLIIDDVFSTDSIDDTLLAAVSELSDECFSEDTVEKAQRKGWSLSLMVEVNSDGSKALCGFMCHQLIEDKKEICIYRLAVQQRCRSHGHGQRYMRWMLDKAAQMPTSQCAWLSLSAVKSAIPFYDRFGFTDLTCADPDDPEITQTWMEMKNVSRVSDDD